ncbi:TPA: hypothetical protein DCE37_00790 [Candidatus Latescibacteria bacterium]|nr:hypothetical protein [Candidatus Latescibacterota bacterium]
MAGTQQRAEVEIFGRSYTLVSGRSVVYAQEIASEVDQRMARIAADQNLTDTTKIAMMVAMEIADELMKARQEGEARLSAADSASERLVTTLGEVDG